MVQVSPVARFSMKGWFAKQGIVASAEQVTVSSQVAWRITSISGKIGRKVSPWQTIVSLQDTNGSISFATRKAWVWLESTRDAIQTQKLALEKALYDTTIINEKNKVWSEVAKLDALKQQEKIVRDLENNDLSDTGSSLSLQLKKLQTDLDKAQWDYETKLIADDQTIENFINSVKLIGTDVYNLFTDTINLSDTLLWVTIERSNQNDTYEQILGNKDFYSKQRASDDLLKTIAAFTNFKTLVNDPNTGTMQPLLRSYSEWLNSINTMLTSINTLLTNTEPWWSFAPTYNTFKTQFDGYKSKASWLGSSITNQLNAINSFFATYQQSQQSLAASIDSLKQQIELSKKSISDVAFNTQLWSDRQLLWLDATLKNQELTDKSVEYATNFALRNNELSLDSLGNSLESAKIAYEEANFARSKFTPTAPIYGTITDILVDRGQEVGPWTPLYTIVNTSLKQVELDITVWEKELIVPWQSVNLTQGWLEGKWVIESVSDIADSSFWYKVIVVITEGNFTIWSSMRINFEWSVGENIVIPLNVVTIVDNGRWVVQTWRNWSLSSTPVGLWAMAGEYVIVTEGLAIDDLVITSDISRFDPATMEIQIKTEG